MNEKIPTTCSPDYQEFTLANRRIESYGRRMKQKLDAIPLPDLRDKKVLDIGCDHGFWSFLALTRGARSTVGLDRGRSVGGTPTDLISINRENAAAFGFTRCEFHHIEIGKQWHEFGTFDVIFLFSLYHHIVAAAGRAHAPVWYWLLRHCHAGTEILWENPIDGSDQVARELMKEWNGYTETDIFAAADQYFTRENIGPAKHVETRQVYRFTPRRGTKQKYFRYYKAALQDGAGGASKAFTFHNSRRVNEIERILGYRPIPGSLNLKTDRAFDWDNNYYRAEVLDVIQRGPPLDQAHWRPRFARFYPCYVNGYAGHAFRFENEKYPADFVEVIAPQMLRDIIYRDEIELEKC